MKIIGKTIEGDLIIQATQAEWDSLGGGKITELPIEARLFKWEQTEACRLLRSGHLAKWDITYAYFDGKIDGTIQSLQDIADGRIKVDGIGEVYRAKLKRLLAMEYKT